MVFPEEVRVGLVEITPEDNSIKSKFTGYTQTRPETTRVRNTIQCSVIPMQNDEANVLIDFYASVGTHTSFTFIDPKSLISYEVRFTQPVKQIHDSKTSNYTIFSNLQMEEV